jgi:hypothetical protein
LLPNLVEETFCRGRNLPWLVPRCGSNILQAEFINTSGVAFAIWSEVLAKNVPRIILHNRSMENDGSSGLKEKSLDEVRVLGLLIRYPKIFNSGRVNKRSRLDDQMLINSSPSLAPCGAPNRNITLH